MKASKYPSKFQFFLPTPCRKSFEFQLASLRRNKFKVMSCWREGGEEVSSEWKLSKNLRRNCFSCLCIIESRFELFKQLKGNFEREDDNLPKVRWHCIISTRVNLIKNCKRLSNFLLVFPIATLA